MSRNKRRKKHRSFDNAVSANIATAEPPKIETHRRVPMSEVLSALSYALDMTEGQPKGHSVRSCMIGMRIGRAAGLDTSEMAELYYALLLKDAGCSANASRIASLFGSDDQYVKPRLKSVNWDDRRRLAIETWRSMAKGKSVWSRVRHYFRLAKQPAVTQELIASRCERGGSIARRLGFPEGTALAIQSLDEHWNGKGHPQGLEGEGIPRLSRIMNLAQTVEVFLWNDEREAAIEILRARSGSWFDPALADMARDAMFDDEFCDAVRAPDADHRVLELEPAGRTRDVDDAGLDQIAEAFADIIDAKSPFTYKHSTMVASHARATAAQMGFAPDQVRRMYRAGLLHDIGKLGVSSQILDKPGPLNRLERAEMKEHPRYTWEILRRVRAFEDFAMLASLHHEKLDGSGYPWGRAADELDMSARILVVADIYQAVTESRSYRVGLTYAEAMQILRSQTEIRLDADAVEALAAAVAENPAHEEIPTSL